MFEITFNIIMFEIEIKVKLRDTELYRKTIIDAGARFEHVMKNIDTYYNAPRDFSKTDEAIRVRTTEIFSSSNDIIDSHSDLTYKGPKKDLVVKTRTELVVDVSNPEILDLILQKLDLSKVITINKRRECYELFVEGDRFEILIDQVENLDGSYTEIELLAKTESEIPEKKAKILALLKSYGYEEQDCISDSYLELVLDQIEK